MSSMVLSGDTSGAVTLTVPAVAGTNTITFPASTGTVVTTGTPATGNVLQVVQGSTTTSVSSSTASFVDTTLTASITPKFSTSKILVLINQNGLNKSVANSGNCIDLKLVRNSTDLTTFLGGSLYTGTALEINGSASLSYLDSPATTSATTYKTQFQSRNGNASVSVQISGISASTIVLLEIAG